MTSRCAVRKTIIIHIIAFFACFTVAQISVYAESGNKTFLFDMGTDESPVMSGFQRVEAGDTYSADRGHGFIDSKHEAFELHPVKKGPIYMLSTVDHFNRHATPVLVDGVRGVDDIVFRADVPAGKYRVTVSMGDLNEGMGCISLFANDQLIEENITFHHGTKRRISGVTRKWSQGSGATGFYDRIRFTADASNGALVFRMTKDDSIYNRLLEIEKKKDAIFLKASKGKNHPNGAPYLDIGEPFIDIPLLGIEIRPFVDPPVAMGSDDKLTYSGADTAVSAAVQAFNDGQYDKAESILTEADQSVAPLEKALVYLWLAGWAPTDSEAALAPKARACLETALAQSSDNPVALEAMELLNNFETALTFHLTRNLPGTGSHFLGNVKACHLFLFAQPGDPLYWKSKIHAARCAFMLDPFNKGNGPGAMADIWLAEVLEKFPDNVYALYYLKHEYDHKNGIWALPDFSEKTKGAPAWAAGTCEGYNLLIELSEWWIANKQNPNGSIGGGWGDDVEFVGLFGYIACVSEGASPKSLAGAAKLVHGMYAAGEVEMESGFIWSAADSEHSTEWTGNTLPMMMKIDFGNPIWVERAMQSAKLMENLWTGINERGQRLFRSLYFGGLGTGGPNSPGAVDEKWAWRGVQPIERVYWYNQHPRIAQLIVEWAEGRLMTAMSTEKEKPKGFICEHIAFKDGAPGGVGDTPWHGPGEEFSAGFGHRHPYSMAPFVKAFEITGNPKFIEPIRLEAEWYNNHPEIKASAKAHPSTPERHKSACAHAAKLWPRLQEAMGQTPERSAEEDDGPTIYEKRAAVCEIDREKFRAFWPYMTTEASATDRVGPRGFVFILKENMGASFQGVGRDFATIVRKKSETSLQLAMYVFRDGEIDMTIRPWELRVGWTYKVSVAQDENLDEKPDEEAAVQEFTLSHRGETCPIRLQGRTTYLIDFEPLRKETSLELMPDLAMAASDIEYSPHKSYLTMRVHNIGAKEVRDVPVVLYEETPDSRKVVGNGLISHLGWPESYDAQTLKFGWRYEPTSPEATFTAVVDPDNIVAEIAETNNTVTATLQFDLDAIATKGRPLGGE